MIPVVDVFAGPGGLNEGFSALRRNGQPVFKIAASFEMEANAVETLTLRSAVRQLGLGSDLHDGYRRMLAREVTVQQFRQQPDVRAALATARTHVHQIELGPDNREIVAARISDAVGANTKWALIGGPPCQAYSLAGRSRRAHDPLFDEDHKHFLYREYLDILERFEPAVFVMENVKGLLSAGHKGTRMFDRIIDDLRQGGRYDIRSLVVPDVDPTPGDYVIHAEDFGIPQRRHRVILLGVHVSLPSERLTPLEPTPHTNVWQAIGDLPNVAVGVSRTREPERALDRAQQLGSQLAQIDSAGAQTIAIDRRPAEELERWLRGSVVDVSLHEPRRHMESDLARYRYLAEMARCGIAPRVNELPDLLRPKHRNVGNEATPFVDRFKVQRWDRPSSTVASHIAKDGHYYIHPDPDQMRSLTVREAARLQTFPDDYYFCGNRTAQYHQVGNAVPPLLANQIAGKVADLFGV